jgi:tetratricopeptide (TPR) repeat protein
MNLRKQVVVPGIPYRWTTNLTDAEICAFHATYSEKIKEVVAPIDVTRTTFVIRLRLDFLSFLDGFCVWNATGDDHTVLYRSNQDWELWSARQKEIEELRQEQAAEEAAEKQLVMAEDNHLQEKTKTAKQADDWAAAAGYVSARAELRQRFKQFRVMPPQWMHWYPDLLFSEFPESQYGIEFFRRFHLLPQFFTNFAHWFSVRCGLADETLVEQTAKIYDEAMKLFPEAGSIPQAASLFFCRTGQYARAKAVCLEAMRLGLKDGTKSGFAGRLKRLEREEAKAAAPRRGAVRSAAL